MGKSFEIIILFLLIVGIILFSQGVHAVTVTDSVWNAYAPSGPGPNWGGVQFNVTATGKQMVLIGKSPNANGNGLFTAYLYNSSWALLGSNATFDAAGNTTIIADLTQNQLYYAVLGESDFSSYNNAYSNGMTFPVIGTNVKFTSGLYCDLGVVCSAASVHLDGYARGVLTITTQDIIIVTTNFTISVNDTRTNSLVNGFSWNFTSSNSSDNNAKSGYCSTTSCSLTNFTGTLNVTVFNVHGGTYFDPYDSPKISVVYNSTSTSIVFNTFKNSLNMNLTNVVNGTTITAFCGNVSNSTFSQTNCTSTGTMIFYNVVGDTNISWYDVGNGTYFNVTNNIGVFNSTNANFTNTTYQGLLNVSTYQLFTNKSISSFNVTNNKATNNTPVSNYSLIPANNGTNNIQVDVPGNYTQNYTCTINTPLSIEYCNATGIYDANVTVVANNGSKNLASFNLVLSNVSLGVLFNSTVSNSLNVGLLQGYFYVFNTSLSSFVSNNSVYQINSSVQLVNLTLAPITVNVNFLDEVTRSSLSGVNITFTVIDGTGAQTAFSTNNSMVALSGMLPPGNYTFRYSATGYSTRDYYFVVGVNQAVVNQTLYLINQSVYNPGIVEVRTSDGALVSGAIITLSRFYSNPTIPNIVEMGTSNSFGQRVMTLQPVVGTYLWNVSVDGVVRYLTSVPESLSIYSDGLWHKTVILNSTASDVASQYTGFSPEFVSPTGDLVNGTLYTFIFNVTSGFWGITGCTYQLVNDSNGVVLNSSSGWCGASSGTTSITYTTDQYAYKIDAIATVTTAYFTNTYQYGYSVIVNSNESFTLVNALGDITRFNGSGFNDFDRFLISILAIVGMVVALSETTDLIANDAEVLLLVFLLSVGFSYLNWMRLDLPLITYPGVQQWGICVLIGVMTLVQVVRRYGGQG